MITERVSNQIRYMEGQTGIEGDEMDNVRVDITPVTQLTEDQIKELGDLLAAGYDKLWQGDGNYRNAILGNATQVLRIYDGDALAAGVTIDNSRISAIAVGPHFQGRGLGVKLFKEASKAHPDIWITVGVDPKSEGMIATLTSKKINFMPVEDKNKIEDLFRKTNQGREHYQVETESTEFPFLSQRLALKGINQNSFIAYARAGSTHGSVYHQILFQNQT